MEKRVVNKKLVARLMDTKGIEMISVTSQNVIAQVSAKFTPKMADDLVRELGHERDAKAASQAGANYIVFSRF